MDGSQFDAWTRRRVGLATGGAAATLFGLARDEAGTARNRRNKKKRNRKKKRCLRLGSSCVPGQGRKCCGPLLCDQHLVNSGGGTFCCKTFGKPCTVNDDCCAPNACINNLCQIVN